MSTAVSPARPENRIERWLAVAAVAGFAVLAMAVLFVQRDSGDTSPPDPSVSIRSQETQPEPWYYDEVNNRHWHPGHGHWHGGPPPGFEGDADAPFAPVAPMPVQTHPEPWEYDLENNRHWHPDHGHWHGGPPPPASRRE